MMFVMKTASISTLRAQLRRFLAAVRRGETIVITDRDAPVARLVPVEKADLAPHGVVPGWFLELAQRGIVTMGRMKGCQELTKTAPPGPARGSGVVDALLDDRRAGR